MITIEKSETVNIDTSEVLRYLGYGKSEADENVLALIGESVKEMTESCSLKACYDTFDINYGEGTIAFGNIETSSRSLMKNLKDCHKVIVFAATIGVQTDRIIGKYSMLSPAKAVIAQAVGTAMVEQWCNALCDKLKKDRFLRPRFSPGYGDFPLEFQENIFRLLDCPRKIGVSLTDSYMMIPSKSVSAIVGISPIDTKCAEEGCEACGNSECEYRRN